MEYIERIFYRKINPSDFKKLYDIDRPEGGGGQTYLEAAGIPNEKIVDFLSYAEVSDSPLKEKGETRSVYTFNASLDAICEQMGRTPSWIPGLLLRADGYECDFYKKD